LLHVKLPEIYFGSQFQRFQIKVNWICFLGLRPGRISWFWEHVAETAHSMVAEITGRGPGPSIPLKGTIQSDLFPLPRL
jgi:hypothetical protein